MLPVSLLLPVRKLGPWLVVPLSLLLLLVVGCLIVLPPCAFGMVALNLARLITLHGSVLVALVTFLNLPSFCLLGMVGSLQIKFVTLMLCMVGWFMCKRRFGPLSIHDLCVLYHGPSHLPAYWSCPLAHSLGLPCLRGLPLWVWLGLFGSFPPWFPFCGVGWFFAGLFAPLVLSGRLGLPTPWSRLFPLGLCPRCSWRAFVVGCCGCCCGCPLALRCLFGGSSDQSSHSHCRILRFSVRAPSKARKTTTQQSVKQFWLTRTVSEEQPGRTVDQTYVQTNRAAQPWQKDSKHKDLAKTWHLHVVFTTD